MAEYEDAIVDAGAEIIWVLEQDPSGQPGTADLCMSTMDEFDSDRGWCVGDAETQPVAGTFDDSPFSISRGFDLIVPRATMEIVWTSNHGTPSGEREPRGGRRAGRGMQDVLGQL